MLRILLVDDEPLVLIGLQGMLEWEKLGYTCLLYTSPSPRDS